MRVLLARRFRGNTNAAQLVEEEGEEPREVGEEQQEEEKPVALVLGQPLVEGELKSQQAQIQTKPVKNHQSSQQTRETILFRGVDSCVNTSPQQILSLESSQQKQNCQLKPSPQRKRRLGKSTVEENDCKQRRCKALIPEETSFLDRKPRAREAESTRSDKKRGLAGTFEDSKLIPPSGEAFTSAITVTSAKVAPLSSISEAASLPSNRPKPLTPNHIREMVSSGAGRNHSHRHGNSREREEEEHLLNWQYRVDNRHRHHAHDGPELIVHQNPEINFEGPLENDPASARGDVSSGSPERQNHENDYNLRNFASGDDTNSVIGRREGFPPQLGGTMRNTNDHDLIALAPSSESTDPNRRDLSRIARASGSGRGVNSSSHQIENCGNGNNKKMAGITGEEIRFRTILKKERGLEIQEQEGDGNCLFRAISLQVYGDPSMHGDVRKQCMDHMERDQEHFSQFVTGVPFLQYIARTRQDGVHGNNPEIQSCSELFNRPIEVFTPENGSSPLNIFHAEYKTGDVPIRLSYHDGNHYNAVIDPLVPTAGLGLGLPGLKPGHADKMQMAKAVAESIHAAADQDETELKQVLKASRLDYNTQADNDDDLQRAIKESQLSAEHMNSHNALSLSDMDATYFELEQAALVQSLQSFSQKDEGKKRRASVSTPRSKTGDRNKLQSTGGDHKAPAKAAVASPSTAPSLPCPSQESIPLAATAVSSHAASAPPRESEPSQQLLPLEEYPSSVQELVMNGFTLSTVVKAFDLVGDNFDHMLSLCLANANR